MKNKTKFISLITTCLMIASLGGCTKNYTFEGGDITTKDINDVVFSTAVVTDEIIEYNVIEEDYIIDSETILDRTGNLVAIPETINTIVSLSPTATDILTGLGLQYKIILADTSSSGIEGINPAICTIDTEMININELVALAPDVLIINKSDINNQYDQLKAIGTEVICMPLSDSLQAIKDDIIFLADYTQTTEMGKDLIDSIDDAIGEIITKFANIDIAYRPQVYFELSASPNLFSCGNDTLIDEIITLCGGVNIYSDTAGLFYNTDESVIAANPDVIITSVNADDYDYNEIKARAGWGEITAVKNNTVYQINSAYLNRPSQNIVMGIRAVAFAIYPELFAEFAV